MPGVHAIFTGADLHDRVEPMIFQIAKIVPPPVRASTGAWSRVQPMPALPTERATYVGQPLAVVVADDRYRAEDALELIELELEPLPALVDPLRALDADAPLLEPEWETNLALHYHFVRGDAEAVFEQAAVVVEEEFRSHRHIASPIETRGVVAQPDPYDGRLLVWSSTQTPHQLRDFLAGALRRSPETLHVRAPDVGGGFGPKGAIYPEELVIPFVAERARQAGQVDRGPLGALPRDDPRPRAGPPHHARRRRRRQVPRAARPHHAQLRRVQHARARRPLQLADAPRRDVRRSRSSTSS